MRYKHYVITRFNLPKRWDKDKSGNEVLDAHWLEKRYQLFEDFCYPSVKNQDNLNFEWWVYFDIETEDKYKNINLQYENDLPIFKSKYEASYNDFELNMPKDLWLDAKSNDVDFIMTTRLDNDDILANNTIEILQKSFEEKLCLLEIPFGYTLLLGNPPKLRKLKWELNPFISLIEPINRREEIKTVYKNQHGEWKDIEKKNISEKTQWIQIIHHNNVSNIAKGKEKVPFGIKRRFTFKYPNFYTRNSILNSGKLTFKRSKNFLRNCLKKH